MTFLEPTWWELTAVPIVMAVLLVARRLGLRLRGCALAKFFYGSERWAMIAIAVISLGAAIFSTAIRAQPPRVHDEFSYLLAADTFAHGRWTNPPHPMWRHFETMHVLPQPTRQSKYPPAQGLFMAAGQIATGHPIVGVWLSFSLACAALYWCLRAWVPRRWAFLGALLPGFRFGSGLYYNDNLWGYWSSTYWGGAAALLGGCLLLGAAFRLMRSRGGAGTSLALGFGLSLLAASRPLEGLALAAPLTLIVAWRLIQGGGLGVLLRRLAPATALTVVSLFALGYYHYRVTGSAWTMPYEAYMKTYDVVRVLRFQPFRETPEYRHEELRQYHMGFQVGLAEVQTDGLGLRLEDIRGLGAFFLGRPLSGVALLGLLFWRDRRFVLVLFLLSVGAASHAVTLVNPYWPHYFAPHVALVVFLVIRGLRVMEAAKIGGGILRVLAQSAMIVTLGTFVVAAVLRVGLHLERYEPFAFARQEILNQLESQPGADLVVVRYAAGHNVHSEWIYNRSDIDGAEVIWAREMSAPENQELLDYFPDRKAWLLEADAKPPRLTPYRR